MIIDLEKFIDGERPYWDELETTLARIESRTVWKLTLDEALRLHYLYERASAALVRIDTFSSDPDVQGYVESLVARAYSVIHSVPGPRRRRRFAPIRWFFGTFPRTFRRHVGAFWLAMAVTLAGSAFGGAALAFDPDAKPVIMPFPHLLGDPSDRVRQEERAERGGPKGGHTSFASFLMTNNIRVSMLVLAFGLTWGIGTIVLLFYNGVILGAVVVDYCLAGQAKFLIGWLLPHGSVEIPAILLAGQAGLILGACLIGRGQREPLKLRLRQTVPALVTLIIGVAILLVWAGIVESFFSQYHEPVLPYWLKISFGCAMLILLTAFLALSGRGGAAEAETQ